MQDVVGFGCGALMIFVDEYNFTATAAQRHCIRTRRTDKAGTDDCDFQINSLPTTGFSEAAA